MKTRNFYFLLFFIPTILACKLLTTPNDNSPQVQPTTLPTIESKTEWLTFLGINNYGDTIVNFDDKENIYVLQASPSKEINANFNKLWLSRVSKNGNTEWNTSYTTTALFKEISLAIGKKENVYFSGSTDTTWGNPITPFVGNGSEHLDFFIAKTDKNGSILWNTFIGSSTSSTMSLDENDNIYILKFADNSKISLVKLNSNGELLQDKVLSDFPVITTSCSLNLKIDQKGNIYISYPLDSSETTWHIDKYANDGTFLWNNSIGVDDGAYACLNRLEIDNTGNVYFVGEGTENWGTPINPFDGGHLNTNPSAEDLGHEDFVAKYDPDGKLLWQTFLNKSIWVYDTLLADNGNLYIAGFSDDTWGNPIKEYTGNKDGFIAELDSANGSLLWNTFIGGDGIDFVDSIAYNSNQYLYVVGGSNSAFGDPIHPIMLINDEKPFDIFVANIKLP